MSHSMALQKALNVQNALLDRNFDLCILGPRLKPSAKRLLASMSSVLAVGTLRAKPSLWLCVKSLQVRLLHSSAALYLSRHTLRCCACLLGVWVFEQSM